MQTPKDVVELLQALIRIPSVNPDGDPGTPHTGEQAIAEYLAAFTASIGGTPALLPVEPHRPNLLVRFPAPSASPHSPPRPRILLAPHLDTVSVRGMTIDPFGGEIRSERVHGRGASDTKGPMAAMLWALHEIAPDWDALPYEIWFTGLMGEEAGNDGAKALAPTIQADLVIVAEPTRLQVVHRHKGASWLSLSTSGRAGHASDPRPTENAILRMAKLLPALGDLNTEWAAAADPALGATTLSIGTIQGGSKVNIVPDHCQVELDLRTIDQSDRWLNDIQTALQPHAAHTTLQSTRSLPPLHTPPDHPLVQALLAAGSTLATAPWFCDAAIFAQNNLPAVAIGPGSIAQAHTADEFIAIDDLRAGAAFFEKFLRGTPAR